MTKILNSIYIDDLTFGADSVDKAFELYTKSKHRLAEAGFNLRKFSSNSTDLLECIRQKEQHQAEASPKSEGYTLQEEHGWLTLCANQLLPQDGPKFLVCIGIHASTNQFILDVRHVGKDANLEPKKRDIVSLTSRIFDPMGILSPVNIRFKVLFQKICALKTGWDDYVS